MSQLYTQHLEKLTTLKAQKLPKAAQLFARLTVFLILLITMILVFTPWIQTAPGIGTISALNPNDRIQNISALVSGQIKEWHVQEGQKVKVGDPIVTIIDIDNSILEKLNAEKAAVNYEYQANLLTTKTAKIDLDRRKKLFAEGLVSRRELELADIKYTALKAKQAKTLAKINQVDVKVSRLSSQTKIAPRNGTITRLKASGQATFIKFGDTLATFIPAEIDRAVVVRVSGLNAPLIQKGQKVRLQFDGWPVLQFSGWPSASLGTFGGIVNFIEPVAVENGRFNVWIVQDPEDAPWPKGGFVSLGSQVRAWVLLNEVSLGYEIWRQLNNFPPQYTVEKPAS